MYVRVVAGGLALVALRSSWHVAVLVAVVITTAPGIGENKRTLKLASKLIMKMR
jgi:hypothetical protein